MSPDDAAVTPIRISPSNRRNPSTSSEPPVPARAFLDRLMTIDEVAAYTQLPKFTLYKMRSEGRGPKAAKLGRHLRYRRSDVDAWIALHTGT